MKTLLIDSNEGSRRSLFFVLNQIKSVTVIDESSTVIDSVKLIANQNYDLVFISVDLKMEGAFQILKLIEARTFELVFTGTNTNHAYSAIKYNPIDFLIKPIGIGDIERLLDKISKNKNSKFVFPIIEPEKFQTKSIVVKINQGFTKIRLSNIQYLESYGAYVKLRLNDNSSIVSNGTLKSFDELLSNHSFIRIHSSTIINITYLKSYIREKNDGRVIMVDGKEFDVSRSRKNVFLKYFNL